LNNDSSWTWKGLLPFFKKSEIATPPNPFQVQTEGVSFDLSVHGFNGKVKVGFPNFFFIQAEMWRNASVRLGFPRSPDLANGNPHAMGVAPNSLDTHNNTRGVTNSFSVYIAQSKSDVRCSAACAYFTPVASRPNLTVILNAAVSRIVWKNITSSGNIIAAGVEYIQGGQTFVVSVEREVVVSAGTIGTPKVLELSGVGNTTYVLSIRQKPQRAKPFAGFFLLQALSLFLVFQLLGRILQVRSLFALVRLPHSYLRPDHVHSWVNAFTNLT